MPFRGRLPALAFGLPAIAVLRIIFLRGRPVDYGIAMVLPLISWGISQIPANFDAKTGEALKYCAKRPDGQNFCLDHPGLDPLTKEPLIAMTGASATAEFRRNKGLLPKLIMAPVDSLVFFDPLSDPSRPEPKIWVMRNDGGCYDIYDNPGVHQQTGEVLQPVTKELVKTILKCLKNQNSQESNIKRSNDLIVIATAPSFDCKRATLIVEKLICASPRLSRIDVEMASSYSILWARGNERENLRSGQIAWLTKIRNICSSESCLESVYQERIRELRQLQ